MKFDPEFESYIKDVVEICEKNGIHVKPVFDIDELEQTAEMIYKNAFNVEKACIYDRWGMELFADIMNDRSIVFKTEEPIGETVHGNNVNSFSVQFVYSEPAIVFPMTWHYSPKLTENFESSISEIKQKFEDWKYNSFKDGCEQARKEWLNQKINSFDFLKKAPCYVEYYLNEYPEDVPQMFNNIDKLKVLVNILNKSNYGLVYALDCNIKLFKKIATSESFDKNFEEKDIISSYAKSCIDIKDDNKLNDKLLSLNVFYEKDWNLEESLELIETKNIDDYLTRAMILENKRLNKLSWANKCVIKTSKIANGFPNIEKLSLDTEIIKNTENKNVLNCLCSYLSEKLKDDSLAPDKRQNYDANLDVARSCYLKLANGETYEQKLNNVIIQTEEQIQSIRGNSRNH